MRPLAGRVDEHHDPCRPASRSPAVAVAVNWILGRAQRRVVRDCGRSAHDVLMRRKTWAFVALKHPVAERVLLRHVEIRINFVMRATYP